MSRPHTTHRAHNTCTGCTVVDRAQKLLVTPSVFTSSTTPRSSCVRERTHGSGELGALQAVARWGEHHLAPLAPVARDWQGWQRLAAAHARLGLAGVECQMDPSELRSSVMLPVQPLHNASVCRADHQSQSRSLPTGPKSPGCTSGPPVAETHLRVGAGAGDLFLTAAARHEQMDPPEPRSSGMLPV